MRGTGLGTLGLVLTAEKAITNGKTLALTVGSHDNKIQMQKL